MQQTEQKFVLFCRLNEPNSYLSNWKNSPFELEDIQYSNVEQYMMYQKAMLFNDEKIADLILKCKSPKQMKALGRKVRKFKQNTWDKNKINIVYKGCLAKFKQNPELGRKLIETEDAYIAEAASYDKIWGIGLDMHHSNAKVPSMWKGQNLLGEVLMKVREDLSKN